MSHRARQTVEEIGGGAWTRATDLRIVSPAKAIVTKGDKGIVLAVLPNSLWHDERAVRNKF